MSDSSPPFEVIQTNAGITSGNSGGEIVNVQGQLVGITNEVYKNYEGNIDLHLGFFIPSNIVKNIIL